MMMMVILSTASACGDEDEEEVMLNERRVFLVFLPLQLLMTTVNELKSTMLSIIKIPVFLLATIGLPCHYPQTVCR